MLLNAWTKYGAEGEGFARWNLACPRSLVMEGAERFKRFVERRRGERGDERGEMKGR